MTNLILRVNVTNNDVAYTDMESEDDFYIDIDELDTLICSAGSDVVADGKVIPSETDLNRAATLVDDDVAVEVDKYFLADESENLLREIFMAGRVAKQYVFLAAFDGETASEPTLEAWDDEDADSYDLACLGGGTPALSWYKAIATTTIPPIAAWTGISLAGSGASNSLELNEGSGSLTEAKDLYFNFAVVIPAGVASPSADNPVLMISYTTN